MAVSADAEKRNGPGPGAPYLRGEARAPGDELGRSKLGRRSGRPAHEVGNAVSAFQQQPLLVGAQQALRESGALQCGPETVAGTGEVMSGCGGVEAGIYPDEKNFQAGSDDIPDALKPAG